MLRFALPLLITCSISINRMPKKVRKNARAKAVKQRDRMRERENQRRLRQNLNIESAHDVKDFPEGYRDPALSKGKSLQALRFASPQGSLPTQKGIPYGSDSLASVCVPVSAPSSSCEAGQAKLAHLQGCNVASGFWAKDLLNTPETKYWKEEVLSNTDQRKPSDKTVSVQPKGKTRTKEQREPFWRATVQEKEGRPKCWTRHKEHREPFWRAPVQEKEGLPKRWTKNKEHREPFWRETVQEKEGRPKCWARHKEHREPFWRATVQEKEGRPKRWTRNKEHKSSGIARPRGTTHIHEDGETKYLNEIKNLLKVAWNDPDDIGKGLKYLYLKPNDFNRLNAINPVHAELIEDDGDLRYKITDKISDIEGTEEEGWGVHNFVGSYHVASDSYRMYKDKATNNLMVDDGNRGREKTTFQQYFKRLSDDIENNMYKRKLSSKRLPEKKAVPDKQKKLSERSARIQEKSATYIECSLIEVEPFGEKMFATHPSGNPSIQGPADGITMVEAAWGTEMESVDVKEEDDRLPEEADDIKSTTLPYINRPNETGIITVLPLILSSNIAHSVPTVALQRGEKEPKSKV